MYPYKVKGYSEKDNIFQIQPIISVNKKDMMTPEELEYCIQQDKVSNAVIHDGRIWIVTCAIDAMKAVHSALGDSNVVYYMVNPRMIDGVPCRFMRFFNSKGVDITEPLYHLVGCRIDNYLTRDKKIIIAKNTRDYSINSVMKKYEDLCISCAIHCGLVSGIRHITWKQVNWDENR